MRILMIHNRYLQRGGEDTSYESEVRLLREQGCDVVTYEDDNRRIATLGNVRVAAKCIWSRETYRNIRRILGEKPFDVVHVQNFFPLVSPSAYYAARAEGVPVVQTLHNYRLLCPVGMFFRDGRICEDCVGKAFAWPGVVHGCYRDSRLASGAVATMVSTNRLMGTWSRMVDVFIAPTEFARGKFISGGLPAERIVVKNNFVFDSEGTAPKESVAGGGLFVGRLSREKGLHVLMEAWQGLDMPLSIVGDGPMIDDLRRNMPGNVQLLGRKPRNEVYGAMRVADFLVMPSIWYETFGLVAIEAFSVGLPVIASRIGAMEELIEDGVTGLLFEPNDAEDLARKIRWVGENPKEIAAMTRRARQVYEDRYHPDQIFRQLTAIYQTAIDSAARRSAA